MATLHSNKENLLAFRGPSTPSRKGGLQQQSNNHKSYKTPNENSFMKPPTKTVGKGDNIKTPATTTRIPLGGKDKNVNNGPVTTKKPIIGSATAKRNITRRRLTPKTPTIVNNHPVKTPTDYELQQLQSIESTQIQPPVIDYGYVDVETIPPRPPPVEDLPLDHVDLDYDYISKATKTIVFVDKPQKSKWEDLDLEWDQLIDTKYDTIPLPDLNLQEDDNDNDDADLVSSPPSSPPPKPHRPIFTTKPTLSIPSQRKIPDYMAPTKSAQAKQRVGSTMLAAKKLTNRPTTPHSRPLPSTSPLKPNQNMPHSQFSVSTDELALSFDF